VVADLKRLIAHDYDRSAGGFSAFADAAVYRYLTDPLAQALAEVIGPVLDVASGSGAVGRQLRWAMACDLSVGQLAHNLLAAKVCADAERLPFAADAFAGASCAFGLNHFPDPAAAVAEMARVAPVVGVLTWLRPAPGYAPRQVVLDVIAAHVGTARTEAGEAIDQMAEAVGSQATVGALLAGAGLVADVREVPVDVPWPGTEAFVDYRLSLFGKAADAADPGLLRRDAIAAVNRLPADLLAWRVPLVLGLGRRTSP
jgi:ubiquinone/menaquinone biosynthesis C-methylase UbiE